MSVVHEKLRALFSVAESHAPPQQQLRQQVSSVLKEFFRSENVCADLDQITLIEGLQNGNSPERPISPQQYLDLLGKKVVPGSINMASPRCLGHMTGALPSFVGPVGELILSLNQNLVKVEASKVFSIIERQTIGLLHSLIYDRSPSFYDRYSQDPMHTLGIVASGGTLANITALWIARNTCLRASGGFAGVEDAGLPAALQFYGYTDAVIIASSSVHYSIGKAAGLLGLGAKNLINVAVDHRNRMDVSALRKVLEESASRGACVIAIIGIAGTTDSGSIDPLAEIAQIARDSNIHFHVDAAWGAPLLFSRSHRHLLAGIPKADSVTVDAHKQMYMPTGCSVLLVRHPKAAEVIEKHSSYILHNGSGDLGRHSIEGSRSGNALFMHAALHVIGRAGYEALVDESLRKARFMEMSIKKRDDFELLADIETNILLYRYIPHQLRKRATFEFTDEENLIVNEINEKIQKVQFKAGRTFVSRTCIHKRSGSEVPILALRAVIANPLTTEDDIEEVLKDQLTIANAIDSSYFGALAPQLEVARKTT